MTLHHTFQKLECGVTISPLSGKDLKHLALVIHGAPQVVRLPIDPDKRFIEVPSPLRMISMLLSALLPDLRGEHWTKPVPPEPHGFMANIDITLEQNTFYLPQRQRIADIHHHSDYRSGNICNPA